MRERTRWERERTMRENNNRDDGDERDTLMREEKER